MKPIIDILEERISAVILQVTDQPAAALVKPTQEARFGDYQVNGVMALAKLLGQNPRKLASRLVEKLDLSDMCETPEIAGPGFINLRLKPYWVSCRLLEAMRDETRLGVDLLANPPVTVIDFSSPNIAKQMHVGHLRSTIIGDVIARILEFCYGDEHRDSDDADKKLIRQNHVGDWGTQFGMLVNYLITHRGKPACDASGDDTELSAGLSDIEELYRRAKKQYDTDPDFARKANACVVRLQQGDKEVLAFWREIVEKSLDHIQQLYDLLHVKLTRRDVRGESFYNSSLPLVIQDLKKAGLLVQSDGAQCVFLDGFQTRKGDPLPLIVQKSDGAYLYATTDLAAIRYRVNELKARRIIYVTDARQKLHFAMVFQCARKAGWAGEDVKLEHVPFGSVLGEDGTPLKTRSGENIKLKTLLDEARDRARRIVEQKNPDLDETTKNEIARIVGIGAVKYADLSNNLVGDYLFSWDKMLAMEGNTAPYMQYAYARIKSIFRKGQVDIDSLLAGDCTLLLSEAAEQALAKILLRYGEVVEAVSRDLRPHLLTNYLFELAQAFSTFYNQCPVLKASEEIRTSRLLLCNHTARTIRHGLNLLGIETMEQM